MDHAAAQKSSSFSMRKKIVSLVVFGVASVSFVGLLELFLFAQRLEKDKFNDFSDKRRNFEDSIVHNLEDQYHSARQMAASLPLSDSKMLKTLPPILNTLLKTSSHFEWIGFYDATGKLRASSSLDRMGQPFDVSWNSTVDITKSKEFINALSQKYTESDTVKGLAVSALQVDPILSKIRKTPQLGLTYAAPIKDAQDKVSGVMIFRTNVDWLYHLAQETYDAESKKQLESFEVLLIDNAGMPLLTYAPKRQGNLDIVSDFDKVILKTAFKSTQSNSLKELFEHKEGFFIEDKNPITGRPQVVTYGPVDSFGFPAEMGWSLLFLADTSDFTSRLETLFLKYSLYQLGFILLSLTLAAIASRRIVIMLEGLNYNLQSEAAKLKLESDKLDLAGDRLSKSTKEQAVALQDCAASSNQISATIQRNSDGAQTLRQTAETTDGLASEGTRQINEMITAVDQISASNRKLSSQIQASHVEIEAIVKAISEIEEKTKLIDDIVFETKILSFNASVEAARAGEHGKGFAVVAQEVGNLATMSGDASQEISSLICSSVKRAHEIVTRMRSESDSQLSASNSTIEVDADLAKQCGTTLDSIMNQVTEQRKGINQIADASKEQSLGMREISKALGELDVSTKENTKIASDTAIAASALNNQNKEIQRLLGRMNEFLLGNGAAHSGHRVHKPSWFERRRDAKAEGSTLTVLDARHSPSVPTTKSHLSVVGSTHQATTRSAPSTTATTKPTIKPTSAAGSISSTPKVSLAKPSLAKATPPASSTLNSATTKSTTNSITKSTTMPTTKKIDALKSAGTGIAIGEATIPSANDPRFEDI